MEDQREIKLEGKSPSSKKISRREALKLIGGTALVVGGALTLKKEMNIVSKGIETEHAIFLPFYERHEIGIKENEIPGDLDFWFREDNWYDPKIPYELPSSEVLRMMQNAATTGEGINSIRIRGFQEGALSRLARNGSKIILGDINTSQDSSNKVANYQKIVTAEAIVGLSAAVGGFLYERNKQIEDRKKDKTPSASETTRKNFLKGAAALGITWATLPFASQMSVVLVPEYNGASVGRILTRLDGFQSNFHPENLLVFFRNVVIADKMLTIAEEFHKGMGVKAKIGFNMGASHSGIEDFLGAGVEFCRFVIANFPEDVLRKIIGANKDIDTFCTSAVLELPKDFKESDIETLDKAKNVNIKRDLIIDNKLVNQLKRKLG